MVGRQGLDNTLSSHLHGVADKRDRLPENRFHRLPPTTHQGLRERRQQLSGEGTHHPGTRAHRAFGSRDISTPTAEIYFRSFLSKHPPGTAKDKRICKSGEQDEAGSVSPTEPEHHRNQKVVRQSLCTKRDRSPDPETNHGSQFSGYDHEILPYSPGTTSQRGVGKNQSHPLFQQKGV